MDYLNMSITDIHNALLNREITPLDLVKAAIKKAKKDNNNAFNYICEKEALESVKKLDPSKKDNLLWGIPYVLKDNFSTKDIPTTASSNILNSYVPVYSSEVYLRLQEQGAILIGKASLDELAMGGSGITGNLGKTYNPWDPTHQRQIGGSSSGSAAACSSGIVPFAIGSDTGDSARKPASYAGLVGLKPTWGRISRFGLFHFAPSLDTVGFFTRNVLDSAIVLQVLAGKDNKDTTSSSVKVDDYIESVNKSIKETKIAVIDEIYDSITDEDVKKSFECNLNKLSKQGIIINHVHMDKTICEAIRATYRVISSAEAISNNANLDGIKFGPKSDGKNYEQAVFNARTKGFASQTKRRFTIGSYSLLKENREELLIKAKKCRHLIINLTNDILKENDAIVLPTAPTIAPYFDEKHSDKISHKTIIADNYLSIANFGGQPSISIPIGFKDKLPFGICITGRLFEETTVLALANAIEKETGLANIVAGEYK